MLRRIATIIGCMVLVGFVVVLLYSRYWERTPEGQAAEPHNAWCEQGYARAGTAAETLAVDRRNRVPNPSKLGHVRRNTCGEYRRAKERQRSGA